MKRITLAILIAAAIAGGAQAAIIPTLTLLPANGIVAGLPGTVVGWGFTLSFADPSDWVILTGSEFTGSPVYGTYVDYLSLANAPSYVAGPAPESPTVQQIWVPSSNPLLGLGEFDINATAVPSAVIRGNLIVHYSVFSMDPNDPNFNPDTSTVVADATLSASAQVDVAPEPPSLFLMPGGVLLSFGLAVRRHRIARRG
jgi:hypothetical protein